MDHGGMTRSLGILRHGNARRRSSCFFLAPGPKYTQKCVGDAIEYDVPNVATSIYLIRVVKFDRRLLDGGVRMVEIALCSILVDRS